MLAAARKSRTPCPCGRPADYAACCGRFHEGLQTGIHAPDAESLMRSRYAAYALRLESYLLVTWHPSTRPGTLALNEEPVPKWIGLTVLKVESAHERATVEFVARYRVGGRAQRLQENSRFVREDGRWYYLDGEVA